MTGKVAALRAQPRRLQDLLEAVEQRLRDATASDASGPAGSASSSLPGMLEVPEVAAIVRRCELSTFEAEVLLLGAAMQLQAEVPRLCAELAGDERGRHPTFGIALQAFADGHWDALLPSAPLRRLRLIELGEGAVLTARPLHLAEPVLHALLGLGELDPRLQSRLRSAAGVTAPGSGESPLRHQQCLEAARAAWSADRSAKVHLQSSRIGEGTAWAAEASLQAGWTPWSLSPRDLPSEVDERETLLALWNRDARLLSLALVIDLDDRADDAQGRAALELLERCESPVVAVSVGPLRRPRAPWLSLLLPTLGFEERRALWTAALPALEPDTVDDLSARFELDAAQIGRVARSQGYASAWDAARAAARPRLEDLAQRIAPSSEDPSRLVLPATERRMLEALVAQVRHKATVQHRWGLARGGSRGLGTAAVFSGPSGTGKTFAAEMVAAHLRLDLYRIDLSSVVSKYIGETEKNLRQVFDAAESGGAVLLFDEADALFGKRTDVKDSRDRHANIEVSYLLQRMESYGGLAILTTNFRKALDDAFLRRLQFIIEFPFPDAELREAIWTGVFPRGVPIEALDLRRLAQLSLPGGNIYSIARNAAYLAADAGSPVTMKIIREAARLEVEKLGRGLTPTELRGWPS